MPQAVPVAAFVAPATDGLPPPLFDLLLKSLPAAARVLEIDGAGDALSRVYSQLHPRCVWHRELAKRRPAYDLIVLHDRGAPKQDPLARLDLLGSQANAGTQLFFVTANLGQWETLQSLIEGDVEMPAARRYALPAIYKRLMDAGWMPNLAGHVPCAPANARIAAAVAQLAEALDIPPDTAHRNLMLDRLLIQARRSFGEPAAARGNDRRARFAVVVPTTREHQLHLNVERSAGLREVGARIVTCRGASSPAEALARALEQCDAEWVLLCHQDVYFARSFGHRLNAVLAEVPPERRDSTLIGFIGVGVNAERQGFGPAGFVIDRKTRADHAATDKALSIDELAIVVSRNSIHRIDPQFGWHLWATDLCLAAICEHKMFARIVRLPLYHNSVNDYRLPAPFYESAARLLAKYPDFGPIPTLCGTVDAKFAAQHVPVQSHATTPVDAAPHAVALDDICAQVDLAIAERRYDDAVTKIVTGVHGHYRQPNLGHRALYYPQLDARLAQLGDLLAAAQPAAPPAGASGSLIIASELYQLGGHSRVLEDITHEVADKPIVVLTDVFRTYHKDPRQLDWIRACFAHANLVVLPDAPPWTKCRLLREFACTLNPRHILYFGHHQDAIPFIATWALDGLRKVYFHHGDHNPSLGCTLPGLQHVDFTASLRDTCAHALGRPASWLPLYVPDHGVKRFTELHGNHYSVVTSGHPAKFARSGGTALQAIVRTALEAVGGSFFHIGPLDEEWLAEIRSHLQAHAIEPSRFVHLGLVPSVWKALQGLDAAVYIGSAPVSGGRASIEAQGCGYPVLCFKGFAAGSLLADYSSYANPGLGWATLDELSRTLRTFGPRHASACEQARLFYESGFSLARFRRALTEILGA